MVEQTAHWPCNWKTISRPGECAKARGEMRKLVRESFFMECNKSCSSKTPPWFKRKSDHHDWTTSWWTMFGDDQCWLNLPGVGGHLHDGCRLYAGRRTKSYLPWDFECCLQRVYTPNLVCSWGEWLVQGDWPSPNASPTTITYPTVELATVT